MDQRAIQLKYDNLYVATGFERRGLFQLLRDQFAANQVLYLGSSIHVTPSFYFSHVTYVDNSETARDFFADLEEVKAFVSARKQYRQRATVQYVATDYASQPVCGDYAFDLVMAIYAPHSLPAAARCLRGDGLLLYLPLPSEAENPAPPAGLVRAGAIVARRDVYRYVGETEVANAGRGERLEGGASRVRFVDNNVYWLFAAESNSAAISGHLC